MLSSKKRVLFLFVFSFFLLLVIVYISFDYKQVHTDLKSVVLQLPGTRQSWDRPVSRQDLNRTESRLVKQLLSRDSLQSSGYNSSNCYL